MSNFSPIGPNWHQMGQIWDFLFARRAKMNRKQIFKKTNKFDLRDSNTALLKAKSDMTAVCNQGEIMAVAMSTKLD